MKLPAKKKILYEKKEGQKFAFEEKYRLVYIAVTLFFIGAIFSSIYGFKTIITLNSFLGLLTLSIILSYFIQIYFFRTIFPMKKMEFLMVSAFGFGPFLTALVLVCNFYIHIEKNTETYKIEMVKYVGPSQYFFINGIPCEDYPELCQLHEDDLVLRKGDLVEITMAKGLFGFEVIENIESLK